MNLGTDERARGYFWPNQPPASSRPTFPRFSLSTLTFALGPQTVSTTSTCVVAWPQGDQLLGGRPWHKANLPAAHWLSLPFDTPEGAWWLSWQIPWPSGSPKKGTPRRLRAPTKLFRPGASSDSFKTSPFPPLEERGVRLARPFPGQHAMRRRHQPCLEAVTRTMAEVRDVPRKDFGVSE